MDLSGLPMPINSNYVGVHDHTPHHLHYTTTTTTSNGPPPPPLPPTSTALATTDHQNTNISSKKLAVKYRECLKNHAASIGGSATDGCGEFMPSGEEGTLEALKCSACHCHRNFHRKETEGDSSCDYNYTLRARKLMSTHKDLLLPGPTMASPHSMIMPLGATMQHHHQQQHTSESDEMEGIGGMSAARPPVMKKRFRTKFTQEQKMKMMSFAERIGWRLQKQEENVVQQFCQEIGIRRRVLKVWMHNNKHNMAKKSNSSLQLE